MTDRRWPGGRGEHDSSGRSRSPPRPWWLPAYDVGLALATAAWLPYSRLVRGRPHPELRQRLGWYRPPLRAALDGPGRPVWVHAVSVGEVTAALPLLEHLRAEGPGLRWVLSTTTATGQRLAGQRLPSDVTLLYAPWDVSPCVGRALATIRPRAFLGMETELWPNLFLRLGRSGVPIAVVNGRLSPRAFPRYRVVRRWLAPCLAQVRGWAMQTTADAERLLALGVDPARVRVTGNLKADQPVPTVEPEAVQRQRTAFGLDGPQALWVAGSTHRGEEAILLAVLRQVQVDQGMVRLLLAPRHPERVEEVVRLVRQQGFRPVRRSQGTAEPWGGETVVVLDTIGELPDLYAMADLAFVGGSLIPHGGQNLLEPARLGKPILVGPSTQNFQAIMELLRAADGVREVATPEGMAAQVRQWLAHPAHRQAVGEQARRAVAAQAGSTARTVAWLRDRLPECWRDEAAA